MPIQLVNSSMFSYVLRSHCIRCSRVRLRFLSSGESTRFTLSSTLPRIGFFCSVSPRQKRHSRLHRLASLFPLLLRPEKRRKTYNERERERFSPSTWHEGSEERKRMVERRREKEERKDVGEKSQLEVIDFSN